MTNYSYNKMLAEVGKARHEVAKYRKANFTPGQLKVIKSLAIQEAAPTVQCVLKRYPKMNNYKADRILTEIKRVRREFAVLSGLQNVDGLQSTAQVGHVYLMVHEKFDGWVKCGKTCNLSKRLSSYNSGDPLSRYQYLTEKVVSNRSISEQSLIRELKTSAEEARGEWFKIEEAKAIEILNRI